MNIAAQEQILYQKGIHFAVILYNNIKTNNINLRNVPLTVKSLVISIRIFGTEIKDRIYQQMVNIASVRWTI